MQRIDAILARFGYCTRHQARKFVRDVMVEVDGNPITSLAQKADPASVTVDGEHLDHPGGILIMLHKPAGYICSHDAGEGDVIYSFFPSQWRGRNPVPSSIGRLDKDATGLILVTDQTQLIHRMITPKSRTEKVYEVRVDKPLDPSLVDRFASGTLMLDGERQPCMPAPLTITGETTCTVSLFEGRYHQVKRMFAASGYHVEALHRTKFGPYLLGDLPEGSIRDLPIPAL